MSNIVGDKAEVVPLIPAGFNPTPTSHAPRTSSASARWT
jgi:ABC-type Zn uptake system ZnuABC Zn-binding protein ZnuA